MVPFPDHIDEVSSRFRLLSLDIPDAGPLEVLLLADDPLARTGLASFLSDSAGYRVAGSFACSEDLDELVNTYQPDVVLWDLGVGHPAPIDIQILELPIVALIADEEQIALARTKGAKALLKRSADRETVLTSLFAAWQGLYIVDPGLVEVVFALEQPEFDAVDLTPREYEVLTLLARGLSNKLIAAELNISEHTVKFHVAALMSKLGAQSRTEAVVLAARRGILIV